MWKLDEVLGLPAGEIVRVVQVRQVRRRVVLLGVGGIAGVTVPGLFVPLLYGGHHAVAARRPAAGAGHPHLLPEGGVDKVRDAAPRVAVFVVAGVRGGGLRREQAHSVAAEGAPGQQGGGEQRRQDDIQSPYHGRSAGPQSVCGWRREENQKINGGDTLF